MVIHFASVKIMESVCLLGSLGGLANLLGKLLVPDAQDDHDWGERLMFNDNSLYL